MFSATLCFISFREREAVKLCSSHKSFPCFHTCKITPVGLWSHIYRVCGWIHVHYRPEVISRHEYMHFKVPENKFTMYSIWIQSDLYKCRLDLMAFSLEEEKSSCIHQACRFIYSYYLLFFLSDAFNLSVFMLFIFLLKA